MNEHADNWDGLIEGVLFAYHTSIHASTKVSPFEIMYGRKARLPNLDLKHNVDEKNPEEYGFNDNLLDN